jgi:hypothetical protein
MRNTGGYIRYFKDNLEDLKDNYSNTFTTKKLVVTDTIDIANIDKVDISGLNKWKEGENYEITYTKGRVGIHTDKPETVLDVSGDTSIRGTLYVRDISGVDIYSWTRKNGHLYTSSAMNNVGIGTQNPATKLDVSGDATVRGTLTVNDLSGIDIKQWTRSNGSLYNTNLNSFVGIGTSTPVFNLDVSGEARIYTNKVKLGNNAGNVNQGSNAVAVGVNTGRNNQGSNTVAVGMNSGMNNQGNSSISVGFGAGTNLQGVSSLAIGTNAGQVKQGDNAIAIGSSAGLSGEQTGGISIGYQAGMSNQGKNSVAIGVNAGATNQGCSSVAIGENSGKLNLGDFSVAIGANANSVNKNNIVINATGTDLNATDSSGLYIAPIKYIADKGNMDILIYDRNTKEVKSTTSDSFYGSINGSSKWIDISGGNTTYTLNNIGIGISNPSEKLAVKGNMSVNGSINLNDNSLNNVSDINFSTNSYISESDMYFNIGSSKNINIANNKIYITNTGKVGINTNNPNSTLDIDGDIFIRGNTYIGSDVYINNDYEFQGDIYVVKYNSNDNCVYVGGRFETILANNKDTIIVNNICKLDLNNGIISSLSNGLTGINGSGNGAVCYTIEYDIDNNIYVGGTFIYAGDIVCNSIARYYNNSWYSILKGISTTTGTVSCKTIAIVNDVLVYIGGNFTDVKLDNFTSQSHHNIACYNSYTNSIIPLYKSTDSVLGLNNTCNIIYPDTRRNIIYVGGKFTKVANISSVYYLAYYDGNSWGAVVTNSAFNNTNDPTNEIITMSMDSAKNNLFIGGKFLASSNYYNFGVISIPANINTGIFGSLPINRYGSAIDGFDGKCNIVHCDTSDNIYVGGEFDNIKIASNYNNIPYLIRIKNLNLAGETYLEYSNLSYTYSIVELPNKDIIVGSKKVNNYKSLQRWSNIKNNWDYLVYKTGNIFFDSSNYINFSDKLNMNFTKPINFNNIIDISAQIGINSKTTFREDINLNNKKIQNVSSVEFSNSKIDVSSSKFNISSSLPVLINNNMQIENNGKVSISGDLYIDKVLYVKEISGITINTSTTGDGVWDICNNKIYSKNTNAIVGIGTNNPDTTYKLSVAGDAYISDNLKVNKIKNINSYISIGDNAGSSGVNSISIGNNAASNSQGAYSVAIGNNAGKSNINQNSIILNATESDISSGTSGFFVAPIRETATGKYTLKYDTSKNEVVYEKNTWSINNNNIYYSGNVGIGTNNPTVPLDISGRTIMNDISATNMDLSNRLTVKGRTNMTDVSATNLDISGYIKPSQFVDSTNSSGSSGQVLTKSGNNLSWSTPSGTTQWTTSGSNISYTAGRTTMSDVSATNLDISGYIKPSQFVDSTNSSGSSGQVLTKSGNNLSWVTPIGTTQWTTSGTNISYTAGNVGIGVTTPVCALDILGDLNVSNTINTTIFATDTMEVSTWAQINNLSVNKINLSDVSAGSLDLSSNINVKGKSVLYDVSAIRLDVSNKISMKDASAVSLDVSNNLRVGGTLFVKDISGVVISASSQWTTSGSNISYIAGRTTMTDISATNLDVSNNLNVKGTLTIAGNTVVSSQWTTGTSSRIYYNQGNVGIGTANPSKALEVVGDIASSGGSFIFTNITSTPNQGTNIRAAAVNTLTINTNSNERLRISANGNVGIGTTNPLVTLDVSGATIMTDVSATNLDVSNNLNVKGTATINNLTVSNSFKSAQILDSNNSQGASSFILSSTGVGYQWTNPSAITVGESSKTSQIMTNSIITPTSNNLYFGLFDSSFNNYQNIQLHDKIRYNPSSLNLTIDGQLQTSKIIINKTTSIYELDVSGIINANELYLNDKKIEFASITNTNIINQDTFGKTLKKNCIIYQKPVTIKKSDIVLKLDNVIDRDQTYTFGPSQQNMYIMGLGNDSSNSILYSYNGFDWLSVNNNKQIVDQCNSIKYNGNMWVAVGSGTNNSIAYSYNGLDWSGVANSKTNIFTNSGSSIEWNGNMWVVGGSGTNSIAYSYNSINWIGLGLGIFSTNCNDIMWNGSMWVAGGSGTNTLAYSYNGINWFGIGLGIFSNNSNGIAWNGNMWVAVGNGTSNNIAYSYNGIDWSGIGLSIFSTIGNDVLWNGNIWVAVGSGTNSIAYSYNGIDWTGVVNSTTIFSAGQSLLWNGNMLLAVGNNNKIAYSYNGINWNTYTNSTAKIASKGNCIAFNNRRKYSITVPQNMWIAVGNGSNTIAYSYDGLSWTGILNEIFTIGLGVSWNGKIWVAVGQGISNSIAYSYNGIDWSGVNNSKSNIFDNYGGSVEWNGSMWIAVGTNNNTIAYSYNGLDWSGVNNSKSIFSNYGNNIRWNGTMWVATGNGINSIAYSYNGFDWSGVNNSNNIFTNGYGIDWNGTMWVADGSGNNSIAYSYDGINWSGVTNSKSIFSGFGSNIKWNGSMWVAVGNGTNTIAYSYNGLDWTGIGTTIFSSYGRNISWNGIMWIALGNSTNRIAYSYNGINWVGLGNIVFGTTGVGYGISANNKYATINCPDTLTLNNYPNNQLDIVSEGYYNRGFTNMSMSIKSTEI